ncbi:hypothetical protein [Verrucosispora sp. WMMD573]|uniref:hypothetical protein n=1 Tax=Verrucosispora sp. WMMD573 TaxID=3015149 RepID=UPI00248BAFDC|nr:hypothetical protein [Verrucosispora sp. WMMD573]WBB52460.1 hypothetical protein O7601_17905 [Verrucosispora sp. WMMD573]
MKARGARQASMYLRELLDGPYRDRWARAELVLRDHDGLNQAAVAKVLAAFLWQNPRTPTDRDLDPEKLKDLVSRALTGKVLSRQTMQLFVDAFGIGDAHAASLWRQWEGVELARVIYGDLPPLAGEVSDPPEYQTISLHEFHYLGADGQPASHRTIQDIRSLVDGLTTYRYTFDTDEVEVERVQGGVPGEPYWLRDSLWAVNVMLPRQLNRGEMTSMEYVTRFHYSADVEPVFRRVAHHRLEKVAIRVQFDPARLPRQVWWTEWADYRDPDDRVARQHPVELDVENAVYHCVDVVDRSVIGFAWQFDPV